MYVFQKFYILRYLIHHHLIFVWYEIWIKVLSCIWTQFFQNCCSKVYNFFIDLSLKLCQNYFFINMWVCFLTLDFVLSIYLSSLTPIPLFQLLEVFNVSISSSINPLTLILFKIVFKIMGHLHSCMNFYFILFYYFFLYELLESLGQYLFFLL